MLEVQDTQHLCGSIHDIHGRRILTAFDGFVTSGRHHLRLTEIDPTGQRVAPGIYYYRIRADGNTLARRMVLMP